MVAAGVTAEQKYCYGCQRVSYFAGTHCGRCQRLLDHEAARHRAEAEWRERFPNAEALQAWRAEQEQRQQVYLAGQERLRLKQREQRRASQRLLGWWVSIGTAVVVVVSLIAKALR